jgi:alpha-glucosidase
VTRPRAIVQQYLDVLRDAAEYHQLVNFHGCTVPRGWSQKRLEPKS